MKPEEQARQQIDDRLTDAGWCVQDRAQLNLGAGRGIAVREFSLATGAADYLLFVDRQAVGTVEAKTVGQTLTGVEEQSAKYRIGLPGGLRAAREPLPFAYETTGVETRFTSQLDPEPRSRPVFTFHRPETLAEWLAQAPETPEGVPSAANDTLRARLRRLPVCAPPCARWTSRCAPPGSGQTSSTSTMRRTRTRGTARHEGLYAGQSGAPLRYPFGAHLCVLRALPRDTRVGPALRRLP